ncbi:hypothetical protein [Streptomyces sp. NPDC058084]|uniref:hypothetical protein n=1 Tax=Streptomyces sp. NPDC058084 TaxID=3346333 RepID=UPI0036E69338
MRKERFLHPLHRSAFDIAFRLPGAWKAIRHWYPRPGDQSVDLCLIWTPLEARPPVAWRSHGATLLRDDDLGLYLTEHRRDQIMVCPVTPAGLHEDVTDRIPAPPSVACPRDPARAAWRITDRVLPHYAAAVTDARRAADGLAVRRRAASLRPLQAYHPERPRTR